MSQITLKEKYHQKRIANVKSKLRTLDESLIKENVDFRVALLLEALDENEYKQATEAIEKLQKINDVAKKADMKLLSSAIDNVVKEINNFTGGTGLSQFKGKVASLFSKTPAKNPILAGLAMVGALEAGFKILPTILKNNISDIESNKENQNKKLEDIVTDEKIKKNIENNLVKAFVPSGTFGKLFGKIPGLDAANLVGDVFMATPLQLGELSKVLEGGTKIEDVDPKLADPKVAGAAADETSKEGSNKQTPEQEKQNIKLVQVAAQKAGIKEEETIKRFLINMIGFKEGIKHPYSDTAIEVLKNYATSAKVADGQLDGFVDGLGVDKDKVINDIKNKIEELEKVKQEKAKKAAEKGQPTGGAGSQLGGALGAG